MDDITKVIIGMHRLKNTLATKSVDSGYSEADIDFLAKKYAEQNSAYYFDLLTYLEHKEPDLTNAQKNVLDANKTITGAVTVRPVGVDGWQWWLKLLDFWKADTISGNKKLIIPIKLNPYQPKENHFAVLGFDFDEKNSTVKIYFLEQHAMHPGEKGYDKNTDYSDMINDYVFKALTPFFQLRLGYKNVEFYSNNKPITRKKHVCGVVATEMARQLLTTDDWSNFVNQSPVLTDEQIDKIHQRNKYYATSETAENTTHKKRVDPLILHNQTVRK